MFSSERADDAASGPRCSDQWLVIVLGAIVAISLCATTACGANEAPVPTPSATVGSRFDRAAVGSPASHPTVGPVYRQATFDPSTPTPVANTGGTWTIREVPNSQRVGLRGVVCSGQSHCIAMGYLTGDGSIIVGPAVLVSADGGASWSTSSLPVDKNLEDVTAIDCAGELRCVGVGRRRGDPRGAVLVSDDGGVSWRETEAPSGIELTAVACAGTNCMAAGVVEEKEEVDTFVSNDGGGTWEQAGSPKVAGYQVSSLACPTADRCYLTTSTTKDSPGFELFVTDNRGSSWTNRTPSGELLVAEIECLDRDHCLVLGAPDLVRTGDGGKHWSRSYESSLSDPILSVACSPGGPCVGLGAMLKVVRSDDGGESWTEEPPPDQPDTEFTALSCRLASGCVAVAQRKQISGTGTNRVFRFDAVILTRS